MEARSCRLTSQLAGDVPEFWEIQRKVPEGVLEKATEASRTERDPEDPEPGGTAAVSFTQGGPTRAGLERAGLEHGEAPPRRMAGVFSPVKADCCGPH